jgi:hypothetical protein
MVDVRRSPGFWALALGIVGGAAGFFGPILLNPEANQGPLLGIFITGPGGAIAGAVLGFIFKLLPFTDTTRTQTLMLLCVALGVGTLWFSLAAPAEVARVIDASIGECRPARARIPGRIAHWDSRVAEVTYAQPRANWRDDVDRMARETPGVVVTLEAAHDNTILRHSRPWNRGNLSAAGWKRVRGTREYFGGGTCDSYPRGRKVMLSPTSRYSRAWPPDELPEFLGLQVLGAVPSNYLALVGRPR